ncbi:hypothetical protein [Luteibacter yeojuensis]|uniref:Uncharacterized protein n=1 Tax=Luteibacter yeojuensis TaxID=345309 RepID=A0A0F3L4L9_9GAMM|nr:hypothetical protein [Luteibacter yeojuensis]KJV37304.1 hypothetical protein VI08_00340 [Luteibacter yeojuensis]
MRGVERIAAAAVLAVMAGGVRASGWPDVAMPAGAQLAETAPRMVFNGTEMHTEVFRTDMKPDALTAWLKQSWHDDWVRDKVNGWDVLGHKDGDYYITVQVRPEGDGSRGDVGITRIPPKGTRPAPIGVGFARPAETTVINDISYPDDPHNVRTLALANKLTVNQNSSWYRDHMAAEGWRPAEANTCQEGARGCVLAYEKAGRAMMIAITAGPAGTNIVANIAEDK